MNSQINISNSKFKWAFAFLNGAGIYIYNINNKLSIQIIECEIEGIYTAYTGGFLYVYDNNESLDDSLILDVLNLKTDNIT